MPGLQKLTQSFRYLAVIFFSVLLLLIFVNVACAIGLYVRDHMGLRQNPIEKQYGKKVVAAVYPDKQYQEVDELLKETWHKMGLSYAPFTVFKERSRKGKYVNVDEHGFRWTKDQGPWPPEPSYLNVFLFGGSTTFGYGLPDDQTIASYLQGHLNESVPSFEFKVYNFGQGFYFSSQERALFEKLLLSGAVPDLAIFFDGVNEFNIDNDPVLTERLTRYVESGGFSLRELLLHLPVMKVIISLWGESEVIKKTEILNERGLDAIRDLILYRLNRYMANKKMIESVAAAYGVETLFVWQPAASYKLDPMFLSFMNAKTMPAELKLAVSGYDLMEQILSTGAFGDRFLSLADMQEGEAEFMMYVDAFHYSAKMADRIARIIFLRLATDGRVKKNPHSYKTNFVLGALHAVA